MNADKRGFKHERLTSSIIGVFYEVYNELGFGFLELKLQDRWNLHTRHKR